MVGAAALLGVLAADPAAAAELTLASRATAGPATGGAGDSLAVALSTDGRVVLFQSRATDLVPGFVDANGSGNPDAFLFDRKTGAVTLVSHATSGATAGGNDSSVPIALSADGRLVLFSSSATDLVPGFVDGNFSASDTYLFDRLTGAVTLVSHATTGPAAGAHGFTTAGALSADGQVALFQSDATDLVPGFVNGNGLNPDVYLYDRATGGVTLVSPAAGTMGTGGNGSSCPNALSADGRVVLFESSATDLVSGFVDGNGADPDVYLYDRLTGAVTLVSHATSGPTRGGKGVSGLRALSADGQVALFRSDAANLVVGFVKGSRGDPDVYLYDRATGAVTLVSHAVGSPTRGGNGASFPIALSADGQVVLFRSLANDLVPGFVDGNGAGNPDAYLYDRATGGVTLVSRAAGTIGTGGNGSSFPNALSAAGRVVLYSSLAIDLVPGFGDGNGAASGDAFLFDRAKGTTRLLSHAAGVPATGGDGASVGAIFGQSLSASGGVAVLGSWATDLLAGFVDGNGAAGADVFVWTAPLRARAPGPPRLLPRAGAVGGSAASR